MKRPVIISTILLFFCCLAIAQTNRGNSSNSRSDTNENGQRVEKKKQEILQQSYEWAVEPPLGVIERTEMEDTLEYNYYIRAVPSEVSYAYACTGNLGAEGKNMLAMEQAPISQFFLQDSKLAYTPTLAKERFYNTRIPMTLVYYDASGSRDNEQNRLNTIFNGNINARAQVGAKVDYLYSKGSYEYQAVKNLNWGFNGSYLGPRYEFQGFYNHYNMLNKENGGITDDLYITDPAELQGGVATINPKSIPTNLSYAHTRIKGGELFLNNRYKVGYWHEEKDENDSIISSEYIPVTSFIWTLHYKNAKHMFRDSSPSETQNFFENTYLNPSITDDRTSYSSLSNTVGVSLLEGFNKYAKFGLSAFLTYEIRKFTLAVDTIDRAMPEDIGLMPFPAGIESILDKKKQNLAWVGAQITKQQGSILTFDATGEIGLIGDAIGEIKLRGNLRTQFPLLGDTVSLAAYGSLYNTSVPYLLQEYRSNHFIWQNDFGKERRLRVGGILNLPWSGTTINVGTETLQNFVYFNEKALPQQASDAIQVFSVTLDQKLNVGILHWDNKITYQTSSDDRVMPLPKLAVFSNLYLLCRIATLHLQLGIDCDYYTRYYAPGYQPATATFYNQREIEVGNYPFMTAYANMKLGRCRFYVMMTHVNQGMIGGDNYFSSPHYPLNPRRFQMGLCIDFHD
ncbi:MAG: putative porin [Bacteroidales bacterium]|nr:putative porin [Bacteroidales bacterium]